MRTGTHQLKNDSNIVGSPLNGVGVKRSLMVSGSDPSGGIVKAHCRGVSYKEETAVWCLQVFNHKLN